MTESHLKKEVKSANAGNSIAAGIAGVIAGGAAVAAAVVMSDKENQKKVKDALVGAKEKSTEYLDAMRSQPIVEKSAKRLEKVADETKQKIADKR